jgi:hypothetical protein
MSSDSLGYTGPGTEYEPQIGSNYPSVANPMNTFDDRDYEYSVLERQIEQIIEDVDVINSLVKSEMSKFTLKISTQKLLDAQTTIWPENVGEVKDYVTYKEYEALESKYDRASKYIKDEYKKSIRGERGSGVFDIEKLARVIGLEAKNIKGFLNAHTVNSLDDSAQKRVAELLQDWSTSALTHTGRLLSFFQERDKENTSKVPESELASLTAEEATRYQALFKARINALNLDLDRELSGFERHFLNSSDVFYNKFLSPAVKFNNSAANTLSYKTDQGSMLGMEAFKASESIKVNMDTVLTDLLQRNEIFDKRATGIEQSIGRRESLKQVFNQFDQKSTVTSDTYWNTVPDTQTDDVLVSALVAQVEQSSAVSSFSSSHNTLANRDDPLAHQQYLLKGGDTITGNIFVKDGVKIDGVDLSSHSHTGLDGSPKIDGSSIAPSTLPATAINLDQEVNKPVSLKLLGYSEGGQIGDVSFLDANLFWQSDDPTQMYEIQITKRDSTTFEE